jgi:sporulation protein YlmC with PRC-barrel domain
MNKFKYTIAVGSLLCFGVSAQEQSTDLERRQQRQQQAFTAQEQNQQSVFRPKEISEDRLKKTVTEINKASSFMGMGVKNLQNEDLGKVQDLVFDPKEGKISYVVLSTGGFLGVAGKSVAVPLKLLDAKQGADHLVLDMSKDQLQAAPGLAQNNWPSLDTFAAGGAAASETGSESAEQTTIQSEVATPAATPQGQAEPSPSPAPSTENEPVEPEAKPDSSGGAAASETAGEASTSSTSTIHSNSDASIEEDKNSK